MSLFYRLAYWVGVTPWEDMAALPIANQISALFDREEDERDPPYGPALDLGCGRGIWSVKLAARGWHVTGIELVPKAIRAAHIRARQEGVDVKLVQGDMTALRKYEVGSGFTFVLDLGAIHGLESGQQRAVGQGVDAVTGSGTTMVLLAWAPARRGPLPHGMSPDDIHNVFPQWTLVSEEPADVSGAPGFIKKAKPCFYRLRRL